MQQNNHCVVDNKSVTFLKVTPVQISQMAIVVFTISNSAKSGRNEK